MGMLEGSVLLRGMRMESWYDQEKEMIWCRISLPSDNNRGIMLELREEILLSKSNSMVKNTCLGMYFSKAR